MAAKGPGAVSCLTWNIAAVNNNPFEYWVSHDDASYLELMANVQSFIDEPSSDQDVEVRAVFPDALFEELAGAMAAEGWDGIQETRELWKNDFSQRKIIKGFLKDKQIGAKRFASMPDRITNTINLAGGGVACRPTVINNYQELLPDIPTWWASWKAWMFSQELEIPAKGGSTTKARPCSMLEVIPRNKYPAVTEEEERISVPLQTLCCAIFDAILVHMLNAVGPTTWHGVKMSLCRTLSTNKVALTISILETQYVECDIVFLQECSAVFVDAIASTPTLAAEFDVLTPASMDSKRDQNSLILVSRRRFDASAAVEVTSTVEAKMKEATGITLAKGDLCAYVVPPAAGGDGGAGWLLCSFHGDTDGLMTVPVVSAVVATRSESGPLRLAMGMDANSYCAGVPGKKLGAAEFVQACADAGLAECWHGRCAEAPRECCTTFNARTYLQPQLNKAVSRSAAAADPNTDKNPKDYIVFDAQQLEAEGQPLRDNQGVRGSFDPDAPFPTLRFPSDHAALLATLRPKQAPA